MLTGSDISYRSVERVVYAFGRVGWTAGDLPNGGVTCLTHYMEVWIGSAAPYRGMDGFRILF